MRPSALSLLLLLSLAAAPAAADHDDAGQVHGTVEFPTSCAPAVQPRFERAVAQLHSFGYDFARLAFEALAEEDPTCGMALWGAAATYLHPLWAAPTPAELAAGRALAERAAEVGAATERERAWIAAIGAFYADYETVDHRTRAGRYRDALGAIADRWTDDHEARIFQALMLLGTAPPRDRTYAQQHQAVAMLTPLLAEHPDHPGIAHYLIHSLDYPELAHLGLDAARRYARIAPSSSHALHMPSHIFVRLGLWPESIASNLDSASAAIGHRAQLPVASSFDELHALDYLEYAYLQTGQDEAAAKVAERAVHLTPADQASFADALVRVWDPNDLLTEPGRSSRSFGPEAEGDGEVLDDLVRRDLRTTLPDQMLVKLDRASMAASLEARSPLLDHRLLPLVWSMPMSWHVDASGGKRLLRRALLRRVPAALVDRPKMGFDPPIGSWLRGPLRTWAGDLLRRADVEDAGLRVEVVDRCWREHQLGRANHDYRLWTVLQYLAWRQAR